MRLYIKANPVNLAPLILAHYHILSNRKVEKLLSDLSRGCTPSWSAPVVTKACARIPTCSTLSVYAYLFM